MDTKTLAACGAAALATAGCGPATTAALPRAHAARRSALTSTATTPDARQARVDAFATVAARLYAEEARGPAGRRQLARIARDPQLLGALRSGRHAAIRAAALRELFLPHKHVVRVRVVRGGRTVVDVGGTFVSGMQSRPLVAPDGTSLGRLDISMQDVLGLTKLEHRFTGAAIVVRGRAGHVIASPPALASARPPASGPTTIAGRAYVVRSITRTGFAGEPLRISVLIPG